MSIFEPDLHSHFKDEMINSSYFASAWFITIFTNSIKHNVGGASSFSTGSKSENKTSESQDDENEEEEKKDVDQDAAENRAAVMNDI